LMTDREVDSVILKCVAIINSLECNSYAAMDDKSHLIATETKAKSRLEQTLIARTGREEYTATAMTSCKE